MMSVRKYSWHATTRICQQNVLLTKRLLEAFRWQNSQEPNLTIYATSDKVSQNISSKRVYGNKCSAVEMGDGLVIVDMGRKCAPFWGWELSPHLTQCRLGRGLPSYQVASWYIQPFGHKNMGRKLGVLFPFGERELGPYLTQCGRAEAYLHAKFHLDPSNRLTTIHQRYRQTGQTDRQQCDSIGRTVLQTVAKNQY